MDTFGKSITIEKLSENNIMTLYYLFQRNDFQSENFYPHPFTLDYLSYAIKSKDAYFIMTWNQTAVAYGLLRGWEEGYDIPSLGVTVDKNYRRLGLGKFMCRFLHAYAEFRGCKAVRVRVYKTNEVAKSLYDELGYKFHVDVDNPHLWEGIIIL